MTKDDRNSGKALRDTRNRGLEKEQERLSDPAHHTPEEDEGGNPPPARDGERAQPASPEHLKNPPQVEGPREKSNDMV
jgi:hypothetical protein